MLVILAGPGSLSMKQSKCWIIPVSWQIGFDRVCFPGLTIAASLIRALLVLCFFCDDPQCLVCSFSFRLLCYWFWFWSGLDSSYFPFFGFFGVNLCLDMVQLELG